MLVDHRGSQSLPKAGMPSHRLFQSLSAFSFGILLSLSSIAQADTDSEPIESAPEQTISEQAVPKQAVPKQAVQKQTVSEPTPRALSDDELDARYEYLLNHPSDEAAQEELAQLQEIHHRRLAGPGVRWGVSGHTGLLVSNQGDVPVVGACPRVGGELSANLGIYVSSWFSYTISEFSSSGAKGVFAATEAMVEYIYARHVYFAAGGGILGGSLEESCPGVGSCNISNSSPISPVGTLRSGAYLLNDALYRGPSLQLGMTLSAMILNGSWSTVSSIELGLEWF